MEITHENLLLEGWDYAGIIGNRGFYAKGDYIIYEHNGIFRDCPNNAKFNGGQEFSTMEEMRKFYKDRAIKNVKRLERALLKAKMNLTIFG